MEGNPTNEVVKPLLNDYEEVIGSQSPIPHEKFTGYLGLLVFTAVLGSFMFGWNIGVTNNPESVIRECSDIGTGYLPRCIRMDSFTWGTVVGAFSLGGLFGGLSGGLLCKKFGRKSTIMYNNIFFIVGGILMALATDVYMFGIGRLIIGIGAGIVTGAVPMYVSEISPTKYRGALGALHQLATVIGIVSSQLLGLPMSTPELWRFLIGATIVPSMLQLVLIPFATETPRYLVAIGKRSEAIRALERITKNPDSASEIDAMIAYRDKESSETMTLSQLFTTKHLRIALIVAIVAQLSQQLCGINGVIQYSTNLFRENFDDRLAQSITVILGCVNLVATLLSVVLMDRAGRRGLILVSQVGIVVVSALVIVSGLVSFKYGSAIGLTAFIAFFAIGLGPIPWLIMPEIFPTDAVSAASSIAVGVNWTSNFVVSWLFPLIAASFGSWTFLPFAIITAILASITFFMMPETKGKTVEEVIQVWMN